MTNEFAIMTIEVLINEALTELVTDENNTGAKYIYDALEIAKESLQKEEADGCVGCAFEDVEEWNMPCYKCRRNCKDYWRAKHD